MIADDVIARGRVLDASVIGRVSEHLRRRHSTLVDSLALITVADDGVRVWLVDVESGAIFAHTLVAGTSGAELDALISDHLVRAGRVDPPESADWTAELRLLSQRGRHRLAESDGAFIMGENHVRLFRVTRRDVAQSTLACAERVPDAVASSAQASRREVSAMVFDASHTVWPGLPELLAPVVDVPIAVFDDVVVSLPVGDGESGPAVGAQTDQSSREHYPAGNRAETTDLVEVESEPYVESVPDARAVRSVDNEFDVTDRIEPISLAYSDLPDRDLAMGYQTYPGADEPGVASHSEQPVRQERSVIAENESRGRRKKVVLGAGAAAGVVGVAVAATALALSGGSATPSTSNTVAAPQTSATSTQLYADLGDLNEARAPAATYVPPPPPPPPTTQTEQSQRAEQHAPRRTSRPKPRPRAVIPLPGGLPPIIVP
ncbi:hypothetical protein LK459_11765 [Gordonia otitidis]|uniref:hypothetical protein n=1 Tax=Gordonia otitidis TaxID=249058 RepID=UPI001D13DF7E|nr:hypothetical protein [Gordonia otitidis]UEA57322.1 hypothetical protein LK459_11765 [Gordonia otitidis]